MKLFLIIFIGIILGFGCQPKTSVQTQVEKDKLVELGLLYHNNDTLNCIIKGERFINLFPDNDKGWQILGAAYLDQKKDSLADMCTRKAISLNQNNFAALTNLAILYDRRKEYKFAEIFYKQALDINLKSAPIYSNYARNRFWDGDYQTAIKLGIRAVGLSDNPVDKAILCLSYDRAGYIAKRDSLYNKLDSLHYVELKKLKDCFKY